MTNSRQSPRTVHHYKFATILLEIHNKNYSPQTEFFPVIHLGANNNDYLEINYSVFFSIHFISMLHDIMLIFLIQSWTSNIIVFNKNVTQMDTHCLPLDSNGKTSELWLKSPLHKILKFIACSINIKYVFPNPTFEYNASNFLYLYQKVYISTFYLQGEFFFLEC